MDHFREDMYVDLLWICPVLFGTVASCRVWVRFHGLSSTTRCAALLDTLKAKAGLYRSMTDIPFWEAIAKLHNDKNHTSRTVSTLKAMLRTLSKPDPRSGHSSGTQ